MVRISKPEGVSSHASGVVTAVVVSSTTPTVITSFTVQGRHGTTVTFTPSATITYFEGRAQVTATSLVIGDRVDVKLSNTTPQTVTSVRIQLVKFEGKVTSITATTGAITITGPKNVTRTVDVSASTTYVMGGVSTPTIANIVVGSEIGAYGTLSATNATILNATMVRISKPDHARS